MRLLFSCESQVVNRLTDQLVRCQCRPRLLFQHQAYSNQEPLHLAEREVAAVVEAVCGPSEAPAIWGVRCLTPLVPLHSGVLLGHV